MRISDWSSDVCSSDLLIAALDRADQFDRFAREGVGQPRDPALRAEHQPFERNIVEPREQRETIPEDIAEIGEAARVGRSEERRVGKECVSTWRYRGWVTT